MPDYNQMSKEERAQYMRDYRARRKALVAAIDASIESVPIAQRERDQRITALEEEVRRLKRELSAAKVPLHQISEPLVHAVVKPPDEPDRPRADRLSKSYFARKKGDKA